MTQEEAIKIFRKEIECLSHTKCEDCILEKACDPMNTTPYDSEYIEAFSMAIKALEQEPTIKNELVVDCISRAEMLKYQEYLHGKMSNEENHKLWKFIKGLPSVTPQTRQGHWIPVFQGDEIIDYRCSCCEFGNTFGKGTVGMNYCPRCGSKNEVEE